MDFRHLCCPSGQIKLLFCCSCPITVLRSCINIINRVFGHIYGLDNSFCPATLIHWASVIGTSFPMPKCSLFTSEFILLWGKVGILASFYFFMPNIAAGLRLRASNHHPASAIWHIFDALKNTYFTPSKTHIWHFPKNHLDTPINMI